MRWLWKSILALISIGFLAGIAGVAFIAYMINHYSQGLPDYSQLKEYEPPIVSRIYAGDGRLLAEYAQERRVFIPIEIIPDHVKNAFISAEDKNFYEHKGVDFFAVARAVVINLKNRGSGRRLVGASTITQQVAKNFLLTNEVSYERKIKEAILAFRMEKALSKDQLLELYMNEIYLGQRAYGVAAAALTYFDKSLEDLSIAEAAYLAALPKAPNNYHPVRQHDAALARRNWVIGRMEEDGHITEGQAELAKASPLMMKEGDDSGIVSAPYFAEEVRREIVKKYGEDSLYKGGLAVRTSINPQLQELASQALREGLIAYDRRHGYRGPVTKIEEFDDWADRLAAVEPPDGLMDEWRLALVLEVGDGKAVIGFEDKTKADLPLQGVSWARKCLQECYALGSEITSVKQVVTKGDVIIVEKNKSKNEKSPTYAIRQIPAVQGALIAIDPHTGRILAMQGGWKSGTSSFNRATQAKRQPGSAFKPFVYLTALDAGFTPATRVLDAPFVIEQAPGDFWRPKNYSGEFYGPTPIRVGVEKSRNLMTVRLADHVGMDKVVETAEKFGIADEMKPFLSYALGAGETTLLRMTAAYGMLVNGGKKIEPTLIDRVQNRWGETIFAHDHRPCPNCGDLIRWDGQDVPEVPDQREQIADPRTAYQIVSILEGVIERGTAVRLKSLGRPLGGKTGTTNETKDAWFIGFSPDLVAGVYVGFDEPKSLGKRETGSGAAAPIFGAFMQEALKETPPMPFRIPPGVKLIRVNSKTGRTAMPGDANVIWEAFVTGTEPNVDDFVLDTGVIAGGAALDPYGEDPYGYGQFGYGDYSYESFENATPIYNEGGVEVYNPSDPMTSFSHTRTPPEPSAGAENVPQFRDRRPRLNQPVPQGQPSQTDPSFSGTGGLY